MSAVIGQAENNFTPIQLAHYTAMLANGGSDLDITLIREIVDQEGNTVDRAEIDEYVINRLGLEPRERQDIDMSPEHIEAVLEGMRAVTTETGGTAHSIFRNFPFEVGGKTGSSEAGRGQVNGWFVGFAPFDEPEIAIVVGVENGGRGFHTAEVVRDILEVYFGLTDEIVENRRARPISGVRN